MVTNVDDLHRALTQLPVGRPAVAVVLREGRRIERSCGLGEYPDPVRG
jgi:S1-C subfamily serine protease